MRSLDSSMSCQGCENCPTCGQHADRHLATSRAKTAREVAKDFLTLVTDRGRACAVASRSPPGPQGPNSSSRCRYSPNLARLRQSLPSRCRSARPTVPRHALHSRSNDAQSGIKPCAPYSSTIAFECALISLIWSSSVGSLRTRHQYPTTALVI